MEADWLRFFLGTGTLFCQDQAHIDSLENMLEHNRLGDDELTGVLLELSQAYGYNAPEKSIEYGLAALDVSRKTGNQINEALALRAIGVGNHFLDREDIAKVYYDSSLIVSIDAGFKDGEGASLYNIGTIYEYMGHYNMALDDAIGAIHQKVKNLGIEDNTIIYLLSDNGGASYTKATDNGPLKEQMPDLYEKLYLLHQQWQEDNLPEKPMWPRIMDKKFIIDGKEYLFPA